MISYEKNYVGKKKKKRKKIEINKTKKRDGENKN